MRAGAHIDALEVAVAELEGKVSAEDWSTLVYHQRHLHTALEEALQADLKPSDYEPADRERLTALLGRMDVLARGLRARQAQITAQMAGARKQRQVLRAYSDGEGV